MHKYISPFNDCIWQVSDHQCLKKSVFWSKKLDGWVKQLSEYFRNLFVSIAAKTIIKIFPLISISNTVFVNEIKSTIQLLIILYSLFKLNTHTAT